MDPSTGAVTKIVCGLAVPTGLAIAPNGTAYVASLAASAIFQKPVGGEPNLAGAGENGGRVLRWSLSD